MGLIATTIRLTQSTKNDSEGSWIQAGVQAPVPADGRLIKFMLIYDLETGKHISFIGERKLRSNSS